MPMSSISEPTELVTAKLSEPSSGARASTRKPASAYALTLMSSKKTKAVKRSPARQKPTIPARKVSTSAWKRCPAVSTWCHATSSAATASTAAKAARPALSGSA
jgi:hypothetical protein